MESTILVRFGEIHLKGQNRPYFERRLIDNIKISLKDYNDIKVIKTQGRFFVENFDDDMEVIDRLTRVFGIVSLSPALKTGKEMEEIERAVLKIVENALERRSNRNGITFKVESRRADKHFPMTSMEISREMGGVVLKHFPELEVDVHNPDMLINVEVRENTYVYSEIIPGSGGMPVGTNGKAALLLSGGIDSPVAGWMIGKRGVSLTAIHFHSFPYTSDRSKEKVVDLCKLLTRYCGGIRLNIVPFTRIQQELYEKCPDSQLTILMRRFMMKIAEKVAVNEGAKALITGESIGQVASQTLDSLVVTDNAVSMPVFRPLIGLDKIEIMETAKKIDTYETSILPYEDCCTVFLPRHPVTHPRLEKVLDTEKLVDGDELIREAIENIEIIKL